MALPIVKTIKEAKDLLFNKFFLDLNDELEVTTLKEGHINQFKTNHPRGALILYNDGSKFSDSHSKNVVHLDRNMRIACLLQIRSEMGQDYKDNMIDAVIDSAAGLKFQTVSKADKVSPASEDYITPETEADLTYYEHSILFTVPAQYQEKNSFNP